MPGYAQATPTYQPALRLVTGITNAENATITTSFDHDYAVGLIVRLNIPDAYGMQDIDQRVGTITQVPTDTTFVVDLDTRGLGTFSAPSPEPWYQFNYAEVVPVGEINSSLAQATRNVL